jgi:hypothetical protein
MTHIWICLLTLFFSLSSPALEGNVNFWQSSLAAKTATQPRLVIGRGSDLAQDTKGQVNSQLRGGLTFHHQTHRSTL